MESSAKGNLTRRSLSQNLLARSKSNFLSIRYAHLPGSLNFVCAKLGTLSGVSEARAVIDSVHVAGTLPGAGGGTRFVVWGHSQGGQATFFTGMIARTYAPELALLGVAAAAPATDLATLMNDDIDSVGGRNITAMTLWSWQRIYGAPMDKIVDIRACPRSSPCLGMRRRALRPGHAPAHRTATGTGFSDRQGSRRYRTLAFAAGQEHARRINPRDSHFCCAGGAGSHCSSESHKGLCRLALQRRQQDKNANLAEHRPWQGSPGQYASSSRLDDGPICRLRLCEMGKAQIEFRHP